MVSKTDAEIWHKRLGHDSFDKLCRIGFFKNTCFNFKDFYCDAYNKAKFTLLSFLKSFIKSGECFDLIHCDIRGK